METELEIKEGDECKIEGSIDGKTSPSGPLPELNTDPVVYQLVRVEGNGKLVPATDEEVMEVEDLFDGETSEIQLVQGTGQAISCVSKQGLHPGKDLLIDSAGLLRSEIQEVAQRSLDSSPLEKPNAQVEEFCPLSPPTLSEGHAEPSNSSECSRHSSGLIDTGSLSLTKTASWMPDFSKLQGEICLDKLSVKELHDTFKATFGRETSVKDKQWLKRRISMGLSNSCDVSTMNFVIKDNVVVNKGVAEGTSLVVRVPVDDSGGLSSVQNNLMETHSSYSSECNFVSDNLNSEQKAAKRSRKPTRRYIEELEVESKENGRKSVFSIKNLKLDQSSMRSCTDPIQNVRPDGTGLVMRQYSLGGSGIQVPYVCRVRRCRPRQNFMSLMEATTLVRMALVGHGPHSDKDGDNVVSNSGLVSGCNQSSAKEAEKKEHYSEINATELNLIDFSEDTLDNKTAALPIAKGGMRRKHHRPWTLGEVVKLVEGVARYGAGRWSEIKRVAFASSYSYRTSVDLKDKWRNLIKASFAQLPAEEGMQNSRKQASIHIPAPILSRVRELSEMQAHVPASFNPIEFDSHNGCVPDTRSGYV